jgi:methylisocitrate lyase
VKAPILANITEFGATPLYTTENWPRRTCRGAVPAVGLPRHEQGGRERLHRDAPRRHAEERDRHHADPHGALRCIGYHAFEQKLDALFAQKNKP